MSALGVEIVRSAYETHSCKLTIWKLESIIHSRTIRKTIDSAVRGIANAVPDVVTIGCGPRDKHICGFVVSRTAVGGGGKQQQYGDGSNHFNRTVSILIRHRQAVHFAGIVLFDLPHDLLSLGNGVRDDDLPRRARPRDSLSFQFG